MAKVLIHDDYDGQIHKTDGRFGLSKETLCGKKLHPISTTHTPKQCVTCTDCMRDMSEGELTQLLQELQNEMGTLFVVAGHMGFAVSATIGGLPGPGQLVDGKLYVDKMQMEFGLVEIPEAIKFDPRKYKKGAK